MPESPGMSTGKAICVVLCVAIAFVHLVLGSAALNYHGAENYESLWFLLVGVPLFVVQILLSIFLFAGLYEANRRVAFAAQVPLAISVLMVLAVFR